MTNRGKITRQLGLAFLMFIGFMSCKEAAEPTTFQGKVVFADDNAPFVNGYIEFTARGDGASGKLAEFRELPLAATNGEFDLTFPANEDIVSISLEVRDTVFLDVIGPNGGLNCGVIPCEEIAPGNVYSNLVISVPR